MTASIPPYIITLMLRSVIHLWPLRPCGPLCNLVSGKPVNVVTHCGNRPFDTEDNYTSVSEQSAAIESKCRRYLLHTYNIRAVCR